MAEFSAREVEKSLDEQYGDYFWEEASWYLKENGYLLEIDGEKYNVEVLDEYTGSEGDWSSVTYVVFKIGDRLFRKLGRYQSHYGNDWDGPFAEVEPVERKVTDYKEVSR